MRAAALHYEFTGDPDAHRRRLLDGLARGLARADVVVGPETATAGLPADGEVVRERAEPLDGETVTAARELVDERGGVAAFGLAERVDDGVANSCVVLEAGREPRVHRQPELRYTHRWTTAYGEPTTLATGVGTVAPVVCGELAMPERRRDLAATDADLVLAPANWGEDDGTAASLEEQWEAVAAEAGLSLVVGNVYRPAARSDAGFAFDGPAAVVSPEGVLAATTTPGEVVVADL